MKATPDQIATINNLLGLFDSSRSESITVTADQINAVLNVEQALTFEEAQKPVLSKSAEEVDALGLDVVNAALPESVEISAEQLNSLKALFKSLITTVVNDAEAETKSNAEEASTDAEKRTWGAVALEAGKWTAATGAGVAVGALTGGLGWVAMGVGGAVGAGALGVKRAVTAKKDASTTDKEPLLPASATPAKSGLFSGCNCASSSTPGERTIADAEQDQDLGAGAGGKDAGLHS